MTDTEGLEGIDEHRHVPPLFSRERDPIPTIEHTGWAQGSLWTDVKIDKSPVHTGVQTPDCPAVVRRYNGCGIPAGLV
jgi:hypothetical protein